MSGRNINRKGFSLIEILVGMAILGVILTAIYSLVISASKSQISQDLEVEMQQNARSAAEFVVRELRNMSSLNSMESTTGTCRIQFTSMTDTDPTISRIFSWSSTDNILRFRFSNAPVESEDKLADYITAFKLTTIDDRNIITTDIGSVRRIDVTVTTQTSKIDPNTKGYRKYSTTTSVTRRN